jgi:hypothetical protein
MSKYTCFTKLKYHIFINGESSTQLAKMCSASLGLPRVWSSTRQPTPPLTTSGGVHLIFHGPAEMIMNSGRARACNTGVHRGAKSEKFHLFTGAHAVRNCFCTKKSVFNRCLCTPLHTCVSATGHERSKCVHRWRRLWVEKTCTR